MSSTKAGALFAALFAALTPAVSHATLGAAPTPTASTPSMLLAATRPTAAMTSYTMQETNNADGVTVREYVLPNNVVFAVTWEGPVRPDMTALLGSYFSNFANPTADRPMGVSASIQSEGDFRVESFGRPGHFFGKAYLPRLTPANLNVDDLR